jgi:pimeloyl-ACP methyl ester carboxylesterase
VLALAVLAVGTWLAGSFAVAHQLTRRPHPVRTEPVPTLGWGSARELRLSTSDDQQLGAWFVPGRSDCPAVLLLHGNGGSRSDCLAQAELAAADGCPVLLVTHRAHGDSTGTVNDFGYSARHDVVAAVGWLEADQPGRPVVIWGRSLGSAAALFAAADLGPRVRGYVLECPYRDLRTAVRNRTRLHLPLLLDRVANAGFSVAGPAVLPDADRISPLDAAAGVPPGTPVLVLAGGADRHATADEAREIAERIGPAAELVVIDGAGHLALDRADPEQYRTAVRAFLAKCH